MQFAPADSARAQFELTAVVLTDVASLSMWVV